MMMRSAESPAVARLIIAADPICLIAEHAEQLAEPVELFFEKSVDRFVGGVARRDAGTAGGDDRVHAGIRQLTLHRAPHNRCIVLDDRLARDLMAGGRSTDRRWRGRSVSVSSVRVSLTVTT